MNVFGKNQSNKNHMNMKVKQIFCAALALTTISAMAATSGEQMTTTKTAAPAATSAGTNSDVMTQLFGDPVIAKGKGVEIKRSQLDDVMTGLKASAAAKGQQIPPQQESLIEARFLQRMIDIQLLLQKSTDADKAEGKKKTDEQIAALIKNAGSQEKFDQELTAVGMTAADLRNKMQDELTANVTLERELGATATDAEAKNYYDAHAADFEIPEMVHVRHILFLTMDPETRLPLSTNAVAAKRKQAEDVLKRARSGEDFAKLAEEYSEDPGSKDNGGDLPPFEKDGTIAGGTGAMVPQFAAAAFSLTNNQISDIVETEYGFHIIQSLGKTPAKKLTLTDKLPDSDETVMERLKEVLAQKKMATLAPPYLEKLEKQADVAILDPTLKASVESLKALAAENTNAPAMTPDDSAK
jgi:parvulin-like peptidyl-prolyl isomerase